MEILSNVAFLQLLLVIVIVIALLYGILITVQAKEAMDDLEDHWDDPLDQDDPLNEPTSHR
jgi:hypothetical protein